MFVQLNCDTVTATLASGALGPVQNVFHQVDDGHGGDGHEPLVNDEYALMHFVGYYLRHRLPYGAVRRCIWGATLLGSLCDRFRHRLLQHVQVVGRLFACRQHVSYVLLGEYGLDNAERVHDGYTRNLFCEEKIDGGTNRLLSGDL